MKSETTVDKEVFKDIFRDHWDDFQRKFPRYRDAYYDEVIKKMLNCGDVISGYSMYVCSECGQEEKKQHLAVKVVSVCPVEKYIQIIGRVI